VERIFHSDSEASMLAGPDVETRSEDRLVIVAKGVGTENPACMRE